jgi:hypothetical protein
VTVRIQRYHRPVINRGPSFLRCSAAIAAAVVADIEARQERAKAYWQWREEAVTLAERYPQRIALVDTSKAGVGSRNKWARDC